MNKKVNQFDKIFNYNYFDTAVFATFASRLWHLLTTPITILLLAKKITKDEQGIYYVFINLIACQSVFELGLSNLIVTFTGFEWAKLSLNSNGYIIGDFKNISRLAKLLRFMAVWYGIASALFGIIVGLIGYEMLINIHNSEKNWKTIWVIYIILNSVLFAFIPWIKMLEGSGQHGEVAKIRLIQSIGMTLASWICLSFEYGILSLIAIAVISVARDFWLIVIKYRNYFYQIFFLRIDCVMSCWKELGVWQFKLAISSIVGYFGYAFFTPIMLVYKGPVVAGQIGMSLAVVYGIQSLALSIFQARSLRFPLLVATRRFARLDIECLRAGRSSVFIHFLVNALFFAVILVLNYHQPQVAERFVSLNCLAILLVASILHSLSACLSGYLRAYKGERIFLMSFVSSIAMGTSSWYFGRIFGPDAIAICYLLVYVFVLFWEVSIVRACRREGHRDRVAQV